MSPVEVILWALAGTAVVIFIAAAAVGSVFVKMSLDAMREQREEKK